MERILKVVPEINYKPLSKYGLTRFFLISVLSGLMRNDDVGKNYFQNPKLLFDGDHIGDFLDVVESILRSMVIDLNYEVEEMGEKFDYKGDLKSPTKIRELRDKLLRSYDKDVARGKTVSIPSYA